MSDRFLCIHGHFYQPPRENPWLEAIELQDSAYPYHDWNERITAECYAPNTASRILDAQNRIRAIVNNYGSISFNFGPTLFSWMAESAPLAYEAILAADRQSRERFSGHGSAMAQAYNHAILPLSNHTDRVTQVLWGIRDFEHRFGRRPEGMWLPEAAVDLDTLDVLAEYGIRFTVLAPRQAARVRKMPHGRKWVDVTGGRIDPSRAYLQKLPSGRTIALFFYDGPISQAVAFEHLLDNGEHFAQRLLAGFSDARTWPQLMHIATDGETYGHHHPMGDMALAYALHYIESNNLARITNYGEFLEQHPPTHEVQIVENSSWSCVHGVERWRSDCGCNTGRADWNQKWREPLRNALDWLRDTVAPLYERRLGELLQANPWDARNGYIDVVLDRSPASLDRFFAAHSRRELSREDRVAALQLLELQRHAMLMYTSCGWFFDELSGIETVQVIQYAGRVVQLACQLFGDHLEQHFIERLSAAQSNIPDQGNGGDIYQRYVKPAILDLQKVGTHYAISSLFERYDDRSRIYCYDVERRDYHPAESGRARFASGQALVTSGITLESALLQFATVHFGDHNLIAGVRAFQGDAAYHSLVTEAEPAFQRADFAELVRILDRHFESTTYSLKSLFRDEQRKIVRIILGSVLDEAESSYRQVYENHGALMRFLADLHVPLPRVLQTTAGFVINGSLRRAFEETQLDIPRIEALLEVARSEQIALDVGGLTRRLQRNLEAHADALAAEPADFERLRRLAAALRLARSLPFAINLWRVQNVYWALLKDFYAGSLSSASADWTQSFTTLGELLDFDLDAVRASVQPPPAPVAESGQAPAPPALPESQAA